MIHGAAADLGYQIYEFSVFLGGKGVKISVKIDSPGRISHSDCERYSRRLSEKLEEEGIKGCTMEISSPGITRKIRNIEEFTRFTGSPVKIIYEENNSRKVIKGNIREVSGDMILISDGESEMNIRYGAIKGANLDY